MKDQRWWTWHLAAGVVILVLLGLHMTVMHLESIIRVFNPVEGQLPTDWANVAERAKSTFFMVTYVLLLAAALFHGLYGLRNILFELNPAAGLKKAVSFVLVVGGLGLFGLGTWAAWTSFANATTAPAAQTASR
jgi:predicted ribosomally synthesized peptide with SipW-like signal peptide